jgi:LacI family transcriptional regulator
VISVFGIQKELDSHLFRLRIPVVNIGYNDAGPHCPSVSTDIEAVGTMAADHFVARGFRNIAYYQFNESAGERLHRAAFVRACADRGVAAHTLGPMQPILQKRARANFGLHDLLGRRLLEMPKPLAVFAEYDDRAIDVMDAAILHNLRVPEQIAILGADDDELRCPFAPVPLSSIDNDEERIGYEAARLLDQLMDGRPIPKAPIRVPPRGVVVRQSTNILAIPNEHVAHALRIIWEHYVEPIDATGIASQIPLSYPQLHNSFVKHVGHSMAEELMRRRIEHAQRLLADPTVKMLEVARQSGFGSADRMGRVFTRVLRITPSDYRRNTSLKLTPGEKMPATLDLPAKPAKLAENTIS